MLGRELFLTQIRRFSKFIIFLIQKIIEAIFDKLGLWEIIRISFRRDNLFHLIMNDILSHLPKSEISRINFPLIGPLFLFARIVIQMRFEVHLPNMLVLRHILTGIDSLFDIVFIFFGRKPIFEIRADFFGQIVLAIDGVA